MNYGYPKISLYLWISIIHFWMSINRFMDIQYSTDLLISKNYSWISKNDLWLSKIHLWISLNQLWISINNFWIAINHFWISINKEQILKWHPILVKIFLIYSSGSPLVPRSKTICAILVE